MRTYHVHMFIPTIWEVQAEDEAQILEQVGEAYKELYTKHLRDWITPELQPEDVQ
jgi:hypothetical protein